MSDFVQQQNSICDFNSSDSWVILSPIEQSIKRKIEAVGTPLKDWDIQINYGIKTGFNDAFIITTEKREEILANCQTEDERKRTAELIRPKKQIRWNYQKHISARCQMRNPNNCLLILSSWFVRCAINKRNTSRNARFNTRPLINKIGCIEYRLWDEGLTKEQALEQFKSWAAEDCIWYDEAYIAERMFR